MFMLHQLPQNESQGTAGFGAAVTESTRAERICVSLNALKTFNPAISAVGKRNYNQNWLPGEKGSSATRLAVRVQLIRSLLQLKSQQAGSELSGAAAS